MEWTALWLGTLLERFKPGLGSDDWRHYAHLGFQRVLSSSLADRENHPAWTWAVGVAVPAVLVQIVLAGWDGWLTWFIQLALIYSVMAWGGYVKSDDIQSDDHVASGAPLAEQTSLEHPAEEVLHQVMGPLLFLLLGQVLGLTWLVLVVYVLSREWHLTITNAAAQNVQAIGKWSTMIWKGIDAIATRMGLLVLALVGRFDAVFEVWLELAPRWRDSHQHLWQQGLQAAVGVDQDDGVSHRSIRHSQLLVRAVVVLVGLNTLLAWL